MSSKRKVSDAVELMDRWYGHTPGWDALLAEEELNMQIGQAVYDLRNAAGLSQQQLAELAGTTQAVISRVENADYTGNAMEILKRVSLALRVKITISCAVPPEQPQPGCRMVFST